MKNFSIGWIIDQDLPDVKKYKTLSGFSIDCPFCGNRKHKFDINLQKNLCRCNACGSGFNALQLHAALCKISTKDAYADLWRRYKGLSSDLKAQIDKPVVLERSDIVPLRIRSAVYYEFLDSLSLSKEHELKLLQRGLDEEAVRRLGYKDAPEMELDMAQVILNCRNKNPEVDKYFKSHSDIRIAGFYDLNSTPKCVANRPGILIPIIIKAPHRTDDVYAGRAFDEENLISGFQIRFDEGDTRYLPFHSKGKKTGGEFAGYESVHFRLPDCTIDPSSMVFERPVCERVVLTEGCLKADVASYLAKDWPFIGILGVNNQSHLDVALRMLKQKYGTKEIILAFDQDYENNRNVEKALDLAKEKIAAAGLSVYECHWDEDYAKHPDETKGIDDYLLFLKKRRTEK